MGVGEVHSLFAFNEWANARVFRAASELSPEQFTRHVTSSFPSIRDTLSHIVAAEWLWLRRWKAESPSSAPDWSVAPDLMTLQRALGDVEAERRAFLKSLRDQDLTQELVYRNLSGEEFRKVLGGLLTHLVNHSTYHRGQITTLFRQVGADPPATDFLLFMSEGAK